MHSYKDMRISYNIRIGVYNLPSNIDAYAFIINSFPVSLTSNEVIRNIDGSLDSDLFGWIYLWDITEYCQDR